MKKIQAKSRLGQDEILRRATDFFTHYGLTVKEQAPNCVSLVGGDGGVDVIASRQEKTTMVDVESNGWDREAEEFIKKLA